MRAARWVAVAVLTATAVLGPGDGAQAHAYLETSNPADGTVLAAAPAVLQLAFGESVQLSATQVDIVDGAGHHVAPTRLRLERSAVSGEDTESPVRIVGDLPSLARGVYRVSWQTLSTDDLHRTAGVLVFGVGTGQSVQPAGPAETRPRVDEASLRWLMLVSLALCLGGALAARLLRSDRLPAARVAARWSVAGAAAGVVGAVLLLGYQLAPTGVAARQLFAGSYGERWLLRESGLLLLLVSALLVLRGRLPRLRAWLLVAGAAMASVGAALLGHAGAGAGLALTWVAADAAHLAAATTWAGTLVVLVLVLVLGPRRRAGDLGADAVRGALRGFGVPAAACVSVMVVTGVYLTSEVVGSVDAALLTVYGRVLLLKGAVVAVAGALALANMLRLRRGQSLGLRSRAVVTEAGAAVVALALAAVLTSGQPAREPRFVDRPELVPSRLVNGPVADLQEALSISPNRPGDNVVLVDVFDTRRPSLGPVREVLVFVVGAPGASHPQPAEPLSDGRWSLPTRLVDSCPLQLQVVARRTGLPDATRTFSWTVGVGRAHTQAAVVSTAPVAVALRAVAGALLVVLPALWTCAVWVHRRRRGAQLPPTEDDLGIETILPEPALVP